MPNPLHGKSAPGPNRPVAQAKVEPARPMARHVAAAVARPVPAASRPVQPKSAPTPQLAPHVAAALYRQAAPVPPAARAAQPQRAPNRALAPHVAAAVVRPPAVSAASAQAKSARAQLLAPHVAAAVQRPAEAARQRAVQAMDSGGRRLASHVAAATRGQAPAAVQSRPATTGGPAVQPFGLTGIGSALWSLGSSAASLAVANPIVSIPLAVAGALVGTYAAYSYWGGSGVGRRQGQSGIEDLPKEELWRMYINPKDFSTAEESKDPGSYYDNDKSPGFKQGMLRALQEELSFGSNLGRKVDFKEYTRLHDLVSEGLKSGLMGENDTRETTRGLSAGETLYMANGTIYTESDALKLPTTISVVPLPVVNFPINDWNKDDSRLANDLLDETIDGLPMVGKGKLGSSVVTTGEGRINVNYSLNQGPVITQKVFDRYYREVSKARTRKEKLHAIVKAVRAVHVTHVFRDANGRLNVNILLNKFLLEQGFDPTVLPAEGLGMFGGGFGIDALVDAVEKGSKVFRSLSESKKKI
jgi:hypothetical protein